MTVILENFVTTQELLQLCEYDFYRTVESLPLNMLHEVLMSDR